MVSGSSIYWTLEKGCPFPAGRGRETRALQGLVSRLRQKGQVG